LNKDRPTDVTCFIISLFTAQRVSNVSTSIFRSLRIIVDFFSCVVLLWFDVCWCYGVVRLGWCGNLMQASACIRLLTYFLTYLLTSFLTYFLPYLLPSLLPYLLPYLIPYLLTYLLPYFLTYFLTSLLTSLLTYFLTYFLPY
jgi:hypothetical protein